MVGEGKGGGRGGRGVEGRRGEVYGNLSFKFIDLKNYYETAKYFIKLRSNPTMNSPTMNNSFPVVVKKLQLRLNPFL